MRSTLLAKDRAKVVRPSFVDAHYEDFSSKFQEADCAIITSQSDQDNAQKRIGVERILERFQNYMDNTFPNQGDYSPPCSDRL